MSNIDIEAYKNIPAKVKLPTASIEPDWANFADCEVLIERPLTFWCIHWSSDFDNFDKINRTWLSRDLKVWI